jgi:prefoldin subunit 5
MMNQLSEAMDNVDKNFDESIEKVLDLNSMDSTAHRELLNDKLETINKSITEVQDCIDSLNTETKLKLANLDKRLFDKIKTKKAIEAGLASLGEEDEKHVRKSNSTSKNQSETDAV